MSIEHCSECDEATGNAGIGDGSLEFEGEVFCDECWVPVLVKVAADRQAEIEQLNERLKVLQDAANADIDLAEKIYANEYGAFDALWEEE
jgi:thioredoxin-like negative regulator of GroEL